MTLPHAIYCFDINIHPFCWDRILLSWMTLPHATVLNYPTPRYVYTVIISIYTLSVEIGSYCREWPCPTLYTVLISLFTLSLSNDPTPRYCLEWTCHTLLCWMTLPHAIVLKTLPHANIFNDPAPTYCVEWPRPTLYLYCFDINIYPLGSLLFKDPSLRYRVK